MTNTDPHGLNLCQVWNPEMAFALLASLGLADNQGSTEDRLYELGLLPPALHANKLADEHNRPVTPTLIAWQTELAGKENKLVVFGQLIRLPDLTTCLYVNDAHGARYWVPFPAILNQLNTEADQALHLRIALDQLQQHLGKNIAVFPHGELTAVCRTLDTHSSVQLCLYGYAPVLDLNSQHGQSLNTRTKQADTAPHAHRLTLRSPHLKRLEDESIHILREAVAEAQHPVMLYSVGKDSSVMLHLARKAFYPTPPPFPLLHIDTRWKFQEMYLFRDYMARESGMELLVHTNPDAIARDINPFVHGSSLHTDVTKTEGLKQALDQYNFDVVFGGARRDEEKSRAKERIFSFRSKNHVWDPKTQRPELWNLYNSRKQPGESIRVFPLSNWTELDIWQYIYQESIPVVPLYFAKERPVVIRNGMLMLVDDARTQLLPGEEIQAKKIRFRTLGCYPLTGAIESAATTLPDILLELIAARSSERQGRAIDSDSAGSMEKKKQAGYF